MDLDIDTSGFSDVLSDPFKHAPGSTWILIISFSLATLASIFYVLVYVAAPLPRPPFASEVTYRSISKDGTPAPSKRLPCWQDAWLRNRPANTAATRKLSEVSSEVEGAELFMSVVVPAYNEEDRLSAMLEEAVTFLDSEYAQIRTKPAPNITSGVRQRKDLANGMPDLSLPTNGYEILIVSDGSTDNTVDTALSFAKKHSNPYIRVITLASNRGKGGAVTHGMRHVRGRYIVFADADGASKFADLRKLVNACQRAEAEDGQGRAVAVGSRAHLVGSEAVVKRSWLRNFLMHSFHLLLRLLTPPATGSIKDTQCGFKLFSRAALPFIVPHMHSEGWIFDVEMLMLAEMAGIPMVEVPVGWHEVKGSKLNVVWDSLGMAYSLAVLRLAWKMGIFSVE